MSLLKTMTPVAVDSEFRSLGPEGGGSVEQLASFMRFLLEWLRTRRDFELTEAYLELFLKVWVYGNWFCSLIPMPHTTCDR